MHVRMLVIIPAYNEEIKIGKVIRSIKDLFPDINVLVINDYSTDKTFETARNEGIKVISHPFNLGYGAAIQTGYKYAKESDYDYVIQMDADGQHDPASISCLIEEIQKGDYDLIIGSRYLSSEGYKAPFLRKIGVWMFCKIIVLITGREITDPTSGFQAMNRKVLRLYASEHFPVDYPDADILLKILGLGFKIKEIPVRMYTNTETSMHSGIKPIYYMMKMFLVIFINVLNYKYSK